MLLRLILVIVACIGSLQASRITFTNSPKSLQPSLSKTMTMSCSLQDSSLPPGSIIGRSVTATDYDVAHVTSILIMRDGLDLASVTTFTPATAMADLANMRVAGDVTGGAGSKGYLNITWTYPSYEEIGEFTCEVQAVSQTGHGVVYSQYLEVNIVNTTVNDLIKFVNQLETRLTNMEVDQQKKDNETAAKLDELMAKDKELMSKDQELIAKDNELMAKYNDLAAKDKQIEAVLDEVKKMETGTLDCGDSSHGWSTHGSWRSKDFTIPFKQKYNNTPAVHVSFMYIDDAVYFDDNDDEFGVDLISVRPDSFTMRCQIYRSSKHIQTMKAGWVSLPQL